ncbi:hypothetical protein OC846_004230 [Tilletia horrida]|uniref:Dickkopf N-terminal cysteine-rich domain-containing protein n=1 Tax=Tilletia horrida TaxID=155126 RepID=A0AAN6JRB1_9BASI|nr:hypothetical protein OC845_005392 [Tilletia horrida]KAK0549073.1 hypothetical protein OC846_004230 [Tilletia horrida]KAK0564646.1 hypothetical protein OC861_004175 [Tilletia horrida]
MFAFIRSSGLRVAMLALVARQASLAIASPLEASSSGLMARNYPNDICYEDKDCSSGVCNPYPLDPTECQRLAADGSFRDCSGLDYYGGYCKGNAIGQPCLDQSQCDKGRCAPIYSGSLDMICKKTAPGTACKTFHGCSGLQLCSDAGKCFLPANGSLPFGAGCLVSSQCKNNQCIKDVIPHTADGLPEVSLLTPTAPLRCNYLNPGQTGCKTYDDCNEGTQCIKGKCVQAPDGTRCVANSQCINVCHSKGYCYTPKNKLPLYKPCKLDSQCSSGVCYGRLVTITRPSIFKPNGTVSTFRDATCTT